MKERRRQVPRPWNGPPSVDPELPVQAFTLLLSRARALLYPHGFRKTGPRFTRLRGETTQRLSFQKSQWRSADQPIEFTLNLCVFVHALDPDVDPKNPPAERFHVDTRIGSLVSDKRDLWWRLIDTEDVSLVWDELRPLLEGPCLDLLDESTSVYGLKQIAGRFEGPHSRLFVDWASSS